MDIRTIFTDFDGVLRLWPADDSVVETAHGLPAGAIRRAAFAAERIDAATTGRMTDDAWREDIACALQREHPDARCVEAVQAWSAPAGAIDRAVLDVLRRAGAGRRLVLVTNATSRLPHDLDALGLSHVFHAVANSSDIGFAKPDARFFEAALRIADATPLQSLYIDDSFANVAAGAQLGMTTHRYTDVEGLTAFLRANLAIKFF